MHWDAYNSAKTLVSLGVDVDAQNLSGKSALSDACKMAKKRIAILLIESGANVNLADSLGRTVLMDAISGQNEGMISLLLENGADVTIQDMNGRNSYHEAALTANVGVIDLVRHAGGQPLVRDVYGNTPFSIVLRADESVVYAVLGSDRSIVDSDGNTPVHIAVERNAPPALLSKLLKKGYPFSTRNAMGETPLNIAVTKNFTSLALILLENGADPYLETSDGENPVTIVFKTKNNEILDAIVRNNASKTDRQGDGLLHYAAKTADVETVGRLVSFSILDKAKKNISGETPEKVALRWNRPEVARLLSENPDADSETASDDESPLDGEDDFE